MGLCGMASPTPRCGRFTSLLLDRTWVALGPVLKERRGFWECACMQVTRLVEGAYAAGRIIAAVCHGPAALLEAKGADGRPLVAGKQARLYGGTAVCR